MQNALIMAKSVNCNYWNILKYTIFITVEKDTEVEMYGQDWLLYRYFFGSLWRCTAGAPDKIWHSIQCTNGKFWNMQYGFWLSGTSQWCSRWFSSFNIVTPLQLNGKHQAKQIQIYKTNEKFLSSITIYIYLMSILRPSYCS